MGIDQQVYIYLNSPDLCCETCYVRPLFSRHVVMNSISDAMKAPTLTAESLEYDRTLNSQRAKPVPPYEHTASFSQQRQTYPPVLLAPTPNSKEKLQTRTQTHFTVDVDSLPQMEYPSSIPHLSHASLEHRNHRNYVTCYRSLQRDGWLPFERSYIDTEAVEKDFAPARDLCDEQERAQEENSDCIIIDSVAQEDDEAEEEVSAVENARSDSNKAIAYWLVAFAQARRLPKPADQSHRALKTLS